MKYEKSCGAVVYKEEYGNFWFLLENMVQGHTSIPKGHVEGNETEAETACREIREETGLEVRLDTVFRHDIWYSPEEGVRKQVVFFVAEAKPGKPKNQESEVASLGWYDYEQAIRALTHESDREVLMHAASYLAVKYRRRNPVKEPGYIWYREHAVDIHGHFIPGVDDGAQSDEETLDMLRLDREEGVQWAFATPHYGEENGYAPDRFEIHGKFSRLSEYLILSGSPIKAVLGSEWYCSDSILERIRNREAFPMGDSDWYMVEFLEWGSHTEDAETILRRLKMMKDNGIKTILAHPERYKALQQDRELVKRICDLNVLLQVNAYDLFLNQQDAVRDLAQWMAKEELVSFIGSDMHGTRIRPDGRPARRPQMKEGIRWLYENVDEEYANQIVRLNAEQYLHVERLL